MFSGESDGRKLEQLETLTWKRENDLTKEKLFDYFTLSRALGLFARFRAREKSIATELSSHSSSSPIGNSDSSATSNLTSGDCTVNSSDNESTHVNTGSVSANNINSNNNSNSNNSHCVSNSSGSSTSATKNGSVTCGVDESRKSSNRNKQSNNSTPLKHHNQQLPCSSESNDDDRKVKSVTCKKQSTSSVTLDEEMHSMTKFVSSHHPNGHTNNASCTLKSSDAKSDKWSLTEARIFAHALEMYGKNFCSIKKAIPWMPAKSIIEQYYKKVTNNSDTGTGGASGGSSSGGGTGAGSSTGGSSDVGGSSSSQFNNNNSSGTFNNCQRGGSGKVDDAVKDDCSSSHNTPSSPSSKNSASSLSSLDQRSDKISDFHTLQVACLTSGGDYAASNSMKSLSYIDSKMGIPMMKSPLAYGSHVDEILGPEIKPVKAKPIFAPKIPESVTNGHNGLTTTGNSQTRGYLQFFQNGQIVLKLKGTNQGQWVQSEDSPCVPRHGKSKKGHKLNGKRQIAQITSHDGASSCTSILSEDLSADETSDDDSHGSSSIESRSLPSPGFTGTSVNVSTSVTSSSSTSYPPALTRLTSSSKITCLSRQDTLGNNLNYTPDHVNGSASNGASINVNTSKSKRDSSILKNDECSCNDGDNCICSHVNNSLGTINGNCNKSKKFKSCNGNTSNRNTINGLSNVTSGGGSSDISFTTTNDSNKLNRTNSESPNRYSVKNNSSNSSDISTSKSNHNGSSRNNSHSTNNNSNSKCNPTSNAPPPFAHSSTSSAIVDLSSKNASSSSSSSTSVHQTPKTLNSSGHKKSSAINDSSSSSSSATGDFAVDLSVRTNTNNKNSNSNVTSNNNNSQYSRGSSLTNKSEAGKVTIS